MWIFSKKKEDENEGAVLAWEHNGQLYKSRDERDSVKKNSEKSDKKRRLINLLSDFKVARISAYVYGPQGRDDHHVDVTYDMIRFERLSIVELADCFVENWDHIKYNVEGIIGNSSE